MSPRTRSRIPATPTRATGRAPLPGPVPCSLCGCENPFAEIYCIDCGHPLHEGAKDTPSLQAVTSSNVDAIGHNPRTRVLYVRFHHGGTYAYFDVDRSVYEEFAEAESKGKFLASEIKPRYQYQRIF